MEQDASETSNDTQKACNCKKSNCLKLYCDCFANGSFCSAKRCNCNQCYNNMYHETERNNAIFSILERNPNAFRTKLLIKETQSHKKGCHCKRSHCLKKYCECFQAGIECSDKCRCQDCRNRSGLQPMNPMHLPNPPNPNFKRRRDDRPTTDGVPSQETKIIHDSQSALSFFTAAASTKEGVVEEKSKDWMPSGTTAAKVLSQSSQISIGSVGVGGKSLSGLGAGSDGKSLDKDIDHADDIHYPSSSRSSPVSCARNESGTGRQNAAGGTAGQLVLAIDQFTTDESLQEICSEMLKSAAAAVRVSAEGGSGPGNDCRGGERTESSGEPVGSLKDEGSGDAKRARLDAHVHAAATTDADSIAATAADDSVTQSRKSFISIVNGVISSFCSFLGDSTTPSAQSSGHPLSDSSDS